VNRSKLRRSIAVVGAAVLGLMAAVAVSSPASAHHPTVKGEAVCTSAGTWIVKWFVGNSETDIPGTITAVEVTPAGTKVTGVAVGTEVPPSDEILGIHVVPGDQTKAELTVSMHWVRNENGRDKEIDATRSGTVEFSGTCTGPKANPDAKFASNCTGVTVTLVNGADATKPAEFVVSGENGFKVEKTVAKGEEQVFVPAANAGKITVTEGGEPVGKPYTWERPEDCALPTLAYASTCDELLFEVTNPKEGTPFTVTFTPSTGDAQTVTVAPGEVKPVTFPGSEGLTVTPSSEGVEGEPFAWEPEGECDGAGGGGGTLPKTGVAAGGIAGGALVLLAIGAALFFVARRRRMRFTA
jgi:LPXTG-motif cell wall-anchored protein